MDTKTVVIFIVALIVIVFFSQYLKQLTIRKLTLCLQKGDFDAYFKLLNSFRGTYFFSFFNRMYMKLNAYILQGNKAMIEETFDKFLSMRLNNKQLTDIVVKAFYYYIDEENKEKAEIALEKIKGIRIDRLYDECVIIFDICILKETQYIDMMLEQLDESEGVNRGLFNYMLGIQYGYLNNRKEKVAHLNAALKDLKNTTYEVKINNMLKK